MNVATEYTFGYTVAVMGLDHALSLAYSALPDAPVQPGPSDNPIARRMRRSVAFVRRVLGRTAPAVVDGPAPAQ